MNTNINIPNLGCVLRPEAVLPQSTCLLKIDMGDGSSQLLQLNAEQAAALGLTVTGPLVSHQAKVELEKPAPPPPTNSIIDLLQSDEFVDTESMLLESAQEPQNANCEVPTIGVVYKIISPEELNLKPSVQVTRGRPKKRPVEDTESTPASPKPPPPPPIPINARTRSGRITRPPKHIEKDFEQIVIKDEKHTSEITTTGFEPLKTNSKVVKEQPLLELPPKTRKRKITSEHRCPSCNKIYLGRRRMVRHFEKYPDHSPRSLIEKEDNETWKFLVDTALSCNIGQKAIKFCHELTNLIHNARTLSKFLFRPGSCTKGQFYVDEILASALGLKPGGYTLNEKELTKDLSIYAYLDLNFFDETYPKENEKKTEEVANKIVDNAPKIVKDDSEDSKNSQDEVSSSLMQFIDITNEAMKGGVQNVRISDGGNSISLQKNQKVSEKYEENRMDQMLFSTQRDVVPNKAKMVDKMTNNQIISAAGHAFDNHIIDFMDLRNGDALGKPPIVPMETESIHSSINITLPNNTNFNPGKLSQIHHKTEPNNTNRIGHHDNLDVRNKFENVSSSEKRVLDTLDKHISINNHLLPDVDDILASVDTGTVTSILDTSTNSDDIMNVDQFVNERFKNITEPDIEIPNTTSLSLDSLDLFTFHST